MIDVVTNIKNIDTQQWADFVMNHPDGNVFQTPMMYEIYQNVSGYQPNIFVAYQGYCIVGVLLSVLISEKGKIKSLFSARSIIIGGPLVINNNMECLFELLNTYSQYIKDKSIYSQIRNQSNQLIYNDIYQRLGFKFHSHLNFVLPLDGEKNIWNRIGKGRIKHIKKAERNDLHVDVFEDGISDELIFKCYDVIKEVYNHIKLPLVDVNVIKNANKNKLLVLFVVKDNSDNILGCRFALVYRECLYGWYAGSYEKFYKLFPNDLLIWETLKWGSLKGFRYFDYGGAGEPNKPYGVRSFKQQMGGELVNFGRYELVHKPFLLTIGKLGLCIIRKLKIAI